MIEDETKETQKYKRKKIIEVDEDDTYIENKSKKRT